MTNNWIRTTAVNSATDHKVLFLKFGIIARLFPTILSVPRQLRGGHYIIVPILGNDGTEVRAMLSLGAMLIARWSNADERVF